jgi:hypothetical protein
MEKSLPVKCLSIRMCNVYHNLLHRQKRTNPPKLVEAQQKSRLTGSEHNVDPDPLHLPCLLFNLRANGMLWELLEIFLIESNWITVVG